MIEFNVRSFYDVAFLNIEVVLRTTCHKEELNLNFVPAIRTTHTCYGLSRRLYARTLFVVAV